MGLRSSRKSELGVVVLVVATATDVVVVVAHRRAQASVGFNENNERNRYEIILKRRFCTEVSCRSLLKIECKQRAKVQGLDGVNLT